MLLRGVNVGKSVQVPMKQLKAILENIGLTNVITYLNSGNVIFDSDKNYIDLKEIVEKELEKVFGEKISVLLKTSYEIISIEETIPKEWNNDDSEVTYVAYLYNEIDKPESIAELPIKKEYINIYYTKGAIVWNIKREYYNRSQITKIVQHKDYQKMTTRNVNTARKLAELCKAR
jgi:uncharacterized protein (DUF1697 family)